MEASINSEHIKEVASKFNVDLETDGKFWEFNAKQEKLVIQRTKFIDFLSRRGFRKVCLGIENYIYVRIQHNIVREVDADLIRDYVQGYILESYFDEKEAILEVIMRSEKTLFGKGLLNFLKTTNLIVNEDTCEKAYFYFQNTAVEVTSEKITLIESDSLNGLIWENWIIPRDYHDADWNDCDIEVFIRNITGNNLGRAQSLDSAIGYMLHRYRKPSESKAVVLVDETIPGDDSEANGGTGKSLIWQALKQLRKVVSEDGRKFDMQKNFALSGIDLDTDIFAIDDTKKRFKFEDIFTLITNEWNIEKKFRNPFTIPFAEAPKLIITTNHTISNISASYVRRMFEVELFQHYKPDFTPRDEFGHDLFHDWGQQEWQKFYSYMLHCCQSYLRDGLVEYEKINLRQRKYLDQVGREFDEFAEGILRPGYRYDSRKLYGHFLSENLIPQSKFSKHAFTKRVKIWCGHKGYYFDNRQSGNVRYLGISDNFEEDITDLKIYDFNLDA